MSANAPAARDELADRGHAGVGLRVVARRAGLSHAAPAHLFKDRAGLLTAVATDGFRQLTERLDRASDAGGDLATLGSAYVDFGLENSTLIDLMFRQAELHMNDADLLDAQRESISRLVSVVTAEGTSAGPDKQKWALVSWAFMHGLVTLAREGDLAGPAGRGDTDSAAVVRDLVEFYPAAFLASNE